MLAKGARLDLHSENGQGPRPIHWASRNGHVAVVDILLSVNIRRIRANGYSTALFLNIINLCISHSSNISMEFRV